MANTYNIVVSFNGIGAFSGAEAADLIQEALDKTMFKDNYEVVQIERE